MEWTDILRSIDAGEGDRVEFKEKLAVDKVKTAICAFANSDGGVVVLGVDKNNKVVGIAQDPEQVQESLTNLLQSGLSAPVQGWLGRYQTPAGWIHWVEVPKQRGPAPLAVSVGGHVKVRRGRSNHEPSQAELQDLYNTFGFVLTEEQGVPQTSPADLDERVFYGWMQEQGIDVATSPQASSVDDLRNRFAIVQQLDRSYRATLYGLLCFGAAPQSHRQMADHFIHCTAYAGSSRADASVSVSEARGCVDEQVRAAEIWYSALGHRERFVGLLREDFASVPVPVIREVLVNAVAHRDYAITGSKVLFEVFSDRVVVTSPGELPNHVRVEAVLAGGLTRSRNQMIANFLFSRRFMDRRGLGYPKIIRALREACGTGPMLEDDRVSRQVRVTLPLRPVGDK
ncbi:MAG: putative DNA binding domain-containing protein [Deltaproteobacteria bacterium]|nr:putative DNA binding domain-containing protein [Deltaproteobacteria bacterium]